MGDCHTASRLSGRWEHEAGGLRKTKASAGQPAGAAVLAARCNRCDQPNEPVDEPERLLTWCTG